MFAIRLSSALLVQVQPALSIDVANNGRRSRGSRSEVPDWRGLRARRAPLREARSLLRFDNKRQIGHVGRQECAEFEWEPNGTNSGEWKVRSFLLTLAARSSSPLVGSRLTTLQLLPSSRQVDKMAINLSNFSVAIPAMLSDAGMALPNMGSNATVNFGPNVHVFSQSSPPVQSTLDTIFNASTGFDANHNAILFQPGKYNISFQVGFQTTVHGLGMLPDDTTITGGVDTFAPGSALGTFWRGIENLCAEFSSGSLHSWD